MQNEEATKELQDNPIRPQSYDVRSLKPRGQTYAVTALAPETVNLGESEGAGATTEDKVEEKEVEVEDEARVPLTKKAPVGMTQSEWQVHRLTHLPYNAACRCCVAGRKRDDQHRRRKEGPSQAQADLDAD